MAPQKSSSKKDERQYEHIKDSQKKRGKSPRRAEEVAARTVNKQRREEGRTKAQKSSKRSGSSSSSSPKSSSSAKSASSSKSSSSKASSSKASSSKASQSLEDKSRDQLYQQAKKMKIGGRSKMSKGQLVKALRGAS